jgi:hypothetical protein
MGKETSGSRPQPPKAGAWSVDNSYPFPARIDQAYYSSGSQRCGTGADLIICPGRYCFRLLNRLTSLRS